MNAFLSQIEVLTSVAAVPSATLAPCAAAAWKGGGAIYREMAPRLLEEAPRLLLCHEGGKHFVMCSTNGGRKWFRLWKGTRFSIRHWLHDFTTRRRAERSDPEEGSDDWWQNSPRSSP